MSTGVAYRGAAGARLRDGGEIVVWLGWNCFTGNSLDEIKQKVDEYLEGKDGVTSSNGRN